jgi:glycosyltransferase involved in cell wall biosynthesis
MIRYHVLIPAYNAEKTISRVISDLLAIKSNPDTITVVDDGSTDRTVEKCRAFDIHVIRHDCNKGKGNALKTGFQTILENHDTEYILCMDADLQHPVASIPDFLKKAENDHSKFIIGARNRSVKLMPFHRIFSNALTSFVLSHLIGQTIKDSQCGYRLIHKDIIKNMQFSEDGYQFESEMILKIARRDVAIDSVSIPTIYNTERSHIGHFKDSLLFIRLVLKEIKNRIKW